MKTKYILLTTLFFSLFACNKTTKTNITPQTDEKTDSVEANVIKTYADTLLYMDNFDDDTNLYGLFIDKNLNVIRIILGEGFSLDQSDENKMFFTQWRDTGKAAEDNGYYMVECKKIDATPFRICKKYDLDEGYTVVYEYTYPNKTMQQVYNVVKEIDPRLKPEVPTENIKYDSTDDGEVSIDYEFKTKKHVLIELGYPGGVTTVELVENKNNTTSKIIYSAD